MAFRKVDYFQPIIDNERQTSSVSPHEGLCTPMSEEVSFNSTGKQQDSTQDQQHAEEGKEYENISAPLPTSIHNTDRMTGTCRIDETDPTDHTNKIIINNNNNNGIESISTQQETLQVPRISETVKNSDSRNSSMEGYGSDIDECDDNNNNFLTKEDDFEEEEQQEQDFSRLKENERVLKNPENELEDGYGLEKLKTITKDYRLSNESPQQLSFTVKQSMNLPEFQRRPLSDTPTHSQWTSPQNNTTPNLSPFPSHMEITEKNVMDSLDNSRGKATQDGADVKEENESFKSNTGSNTVLSSPYVPTTDNENALFTETDITCSTSGNDTDSSYSFSNVSQTPYDMGNQFSTTTTTTTNTTHNLKSRKHLKKPPHKKRTTNNMTTLDVPGLTKSKTSPDGHIAQQDAGSKLIIIMVGLPATGKSFLTNKLSRYLNFSMYECRVFNVGNTRREYSNRHKDQVPEQDANFFDPTNENSTCLREQWAMDTLDQLLDYLLDMNGNVAIFDATNTTKLRRYNVVNRIRQRSKDLNIVFLESICSDEELVARNIRLKLLGPDYKGKDTHKSLNDFENRLKQYKKAYQPLDDKEAKSYDVSYIKMIDVGKKVISYNIQGYLASQTIYYLLNFNLSDRQIWITRNGESDYNVSGKIGGNSKLTVRGLKYSKALAEFIKFKRKEFNHDLKLKYTRLQNDLEQKEAHIVNKMTNGDAKHGSNGNATHNHLHVHNHHHAPNFFVWTSMLKRSVESAQFFDEDQFPIKQMKMLNELSAGDFEGLTYEQIQQDFPEEFEERVHAKLRYRYPGIGGESYFDVINRLRTVITELERITDNVLIICHRVVARVLLGYFLNLSKEIYSNLDVPLHSVYCLETTPYGVTWKLFEFDEASNTFHEVPQDEANTRVVQQIGIVHQERRYSVVPTFSHTESRQRGLTDLTSKKEISASNGVISRPSSIAGLHKLENISTNPFHVSRAVPVSSIMHSQNSKNGGGSLLLRNATWNNDTSDHPHSNNDTIINSPSSTSLSDDVSNATTKEEIMSTLQSHQLEIEKLTEKLLNLKQQDSSL